MTLLVSLYSRTEIFYYKNMYCRGNEKPMVLSTVGTGSRYITGDGNHVPKANNESTLIL
jgi:hypothetical protein